jgi:hypothetical protein
MPSLVNRVLLVAVVVAGVGGSAYRAIASQGSGRQVTPAFRFDPTWPKLLPNHWMLGQVAGVAVDSRDHIWIVQRPGSLTAAEKMAALNPPEAECCVPAPPVIEFDQEGSVLRHWGGPGAGYQWPQSEHGIFVDVHDNVWIAGNGAKDAELLKFTVDGKFVMQIGHQGQSHGSNDIDNLGKAADIFVDDAVNEVYVADGYGNRRVIVFDSQTGKYKRHWGAYGRRPEDPPPPAGGRGQASDAAPPIALRGTSAGGVGAAVMAPFNPDLPVDKRPQQFNIPHCVTIANDGTVYVCDRNNHRIQVFKKDGTFIKEAFIGQSVGFGAAVSRIGFSTDPGQRFLYVVDLINQRLWIVARDTLEVVSSFGGRRGHGVGDQFDIMHSMAVDHKGNIYIGEVEEGKRVERFLYTGMQAPTSERGR